MREIVPKLLQLILKVFSKFTSNTINKDLKILKVILEESFEVRHYNTNNAFLMSLMLNLFEADSAIKVWASK